MNILIIINDAPYGSDKAYNAMRLATTLQKECADAAVRVFLMADAVTCALPNQSTPNGYYNMERMFKGFVSGGGQVKACGSCADARGIKTLNLVAGIEISNMRELAQWTVESDRVITF